MFLHIDMDYFFAQLEEKRHPEYAGKVLVVCVFSKESGDSGVVSTVNYEGRKYGIHSGQPIFQAKKRAPADSVFIPVDHVHYQSASKQIAEIIRKYGHAQQTSIDEWFLEIDRIPEETARAIKSEILEKAGLTCSIGVAPSMLGAKMAAEKSKPDGLLFLDDESERNFIEGSELQKVVGIGKKTAELLHGLGARKVNDLKKLDPVLIAEQFGKKTGSWLISLAQGRYSGIMKHGQEEQAEVSRMGTLETETHDIHQIMAKITEIERDNKDWVKRNKKAFKTLILVFVTQDMKLHTKSISFRKPKHAEEDLEPEKMLLAREFLAENRLSVRRVGIKYTNFTDVSGQKTLGDDFLNLLEF